MSWVLPGQGEFFTRHQEGTQPGRLTQTGQIKQGIWYHVPLCWVLGGGAGWGASESRLRSTWVIGRWELLCTFCCLFCIFFLRVLLSLLFTSFAVLLNCPYADPGGLFLPFSFHVPPHSSRGKGRQSDHVVLCFAVREPQHNYFSSLFFYSKNVKSCFTEKQAAR